jgi:hypothetical protein
MASFDVKIKSYRANTWDKSRNIVKWRAMSGVKKKMQKKERKDREENNMRQNQNSFIADTARE